MCLEAIWGFNIQTLSCSGYDHNWVRGYDYDDDYAPLLPKGTILHIIGYMDNSPTNKNVPDPRNWQGSGNRSVANMFIDLGMGLSLTDEQFQAEMAKRREQHEADAAGRVHRLSAVQCSPPRADGDADQYDGRRARSRRSRVSDRGSGIRDQGEMTGASGGGQVRGLALDARRRGSRQRARRRTRAARTRRRRSRAGSRTPTASFNFLFGYMNRNWEEELIVPIGPDNNIEPGGPDQGQPTRLLPRRNRFVFRVRVPKDWGQKELVWTLTTKGKTEKAYASLRPDYFIDDVVIASETGALGAGTSSPEIRANKRPTVKLDGDDDAHRARRRTADDRRLGHGRRRAQAAHIRSVGSAPRPAAPSNTSPIAPRNPALVPPIRVTVGKRVGLHLSWFVVPRPQPAAPIRKYVRAAQVKVWEDTRTGREFAMGAALGAAAGAEGRQLRRCR